MRFFTIFTIINALCFLLVGINFRVLFGSVLRHTWAYWIALFLFSQSYWIVRRLNLELPGWVYYGVAVLFGIFILSFFTLLFFDLLMLFLRLPPLKGAFVYIQTHLAEAGFILLTLILIQSALGIFFCGFTALTRYEIKNKDIAGSLRVVQLSDLHIAPYTSPNRMRKLVERVNALNPDIIALTGDIIDGDIEPYLKKGMPDIFGGFKSKYGVFAVMGNHEYYGGRFKRVVSAYEDSGFTLLRDETKTIEEAQVTVAGRDDYVSPAFKGSGRLRLNRFLGEPAERRFPVILLNHQPRTMEESVASKIAVELTGHTHNAQIFPLNIVLKFMYPISKGMLQKGDYTLIVHSGTGFWGLPMRTNSMSEIVVLNIN